MHRWSAALFQQQTLGSRLRSVYQGAQQRTGIHGARLLLLEHEAWSRVFYQTGNVMPTWERFPPKQCTVAQEQQRLGRELHDPFTQLFYSVILYADATRLALIADKKANPASSGVAPSVKRIIGCQQA